MLRKLLGYAGYMFGANSLTALLNFAVSALGMATRPKDAVGDYALYMMIYSTTTSLFVNGANASIQRYSANDALNRKRFLNLMYKVCLGLIAVTSVIAVGAWTFGAKYSLAALCVPWTITYWYARYLLRSQLDAKREARLMVFGSLGITVFQFVFLTFTDLRDALIYGDFIAMAGVAIFALATLPKSLHSTFSEIRALEVPREFVKDVLAFASPLWLSGQVYTAKNALQGAWAGARIGVAAMGTMQVMQTMWQFAAKPIEYLGQASLPGFVSAQGDRDILYRDLLRFCLLTLPVVGLCVAGGIPVIFWIIDFGYALFGGHGIPIREKYAEVPKLMLLLPLGLPMAAIELVTNQYSVAVNKRRSVLFAQLLNLVVMAIALIPLASAYGLPGVLLTGAIGEVCNAMTYVVTLYKDHRDSMRTALFWGTYTTVATFTGMVILYRFHDHELGFLAVIPAVGCYFFLMLMGGLIAKSDFDRLMGAVLRRRPGSAPSP